MKIEFLQKPIANMPTRWTIATSEEEFHAVQAGHVDRGFHDEWSLGDEANSAVTHFFDRVVVVCVPVSVSHSVLVHEAVHVFQAMLRDMGEQDAGMEIEAYCVQFIFDQMCAEMAKRRQLVLRKTKPVTEKRQYRSVNRGKIIA